jgi:hypothetical protein
MKYFYSKSKGLNADIERHRKKRDMLLQKISDLESGDFESKEVYIRTYKNFLFILEQSLANTVNKLGKNKG